MTEEVILSVKDVVVHFGEAKILNGISLNINSGQTVGIIGPNGSGKTTLFNCISGFHQATSGTITFRGSDISSAPPFRRARHGLGRVFQNFGIFREMTVLENVIVALEGKEKLGPSLLPWSQSTRRYKEEAEKYLSRVSLQEKATLKAGSLSGGQMRLLEIIRTLAAGAELFLLDEPTAGVSPKMKDDIARLILDLQNEGKSIVVIEHDVNFIEKFCPRIIVLNQGQIVLDNSPEVVRQSPLLHEIYFGNQN